jgi:hypothetical protein
MWIVKVDRETEQEGKLTTQTPVDAEEMEGMEVLDTVQDQLHNLRIPGSASWDDSDEGLEPDLDEDVSGPYDTDDSSLYDSSSRTSSNPNSEIIPKQPEAAPATAAQVIKASCIPDIRFLRLPHAGVPYTKYCGWEPTSTPKILDNILRSLDSISQNFRNVPLEVKDDPCVAYHLHSRFGSERTIESMNVLALSPSLLDYDRVRLEIAHLMRIQIASTRLEPGGLRRVFRDLVWSNRDRNALNHEAWHGTVHLPLMQLLRIQYPELSVEQVRYIKPGLQNTATYTSATPSNETADFRISWDFDHDSSTDEEAPLLDASIITFWPPENSHDSRRIVVTETRRRWILDFTVKAQLALSATSQLHRLHQIQKGDAYFSFAIPMLVAIRHEWWLCFALDGEKMEIVKYGTLGYTERLDTTLELLGRLKAVMEFVNEEVLPGYRAEVFHKGKEGGKV